MTADGADGVVDDDDENLAPVVSENATTRDARDDVAMTVKSAMGRSVVSFSRAFVNPVARRPFVSPMVGKPPTTGGPAAKRARPAATAAAKSTTAKSTTATAKSTTVDGAEKAAFVCLYARRKAGASSGKQRQAKTFLDGVVVADVVSKTAELYSIQGTRVAKGAAGTLVEGTTTTCGTYEVEVMEPVSTADVLSGAVFSRGGGSAPTAEQRELVSERARPKAFVAPVRGAMRPSSAAGPSSTSSKPFATEAPLHSADAENALVLSTLDTNFFRRDARTACAVVCDPYISRHLRSHQRDGVKFMYECVMGLRTSVHTSKAHTGCLLAHEMGLGKTLQVIALVWTLLKQSPFKRGQPTCRRVVICVPASLVGNWRVEFQKWLGVERCEPMVVEGGDKEAKSNLQDFARPSQRRYQVLITSYETLRAQADVVAGAKVDLLVCDEAHRLKNATQSTKGAMALESLRCLRRVLLTGTPIQNDLDELWSVMDFACPGLMGDLASFRQIYSIPIERARERGAKEEAIRIGDARREQVGLLIDPFIHSRKADEINARLLPPKTEYVVFVRLTSSQEELYLDQLKQKSMQSMLGRIGKSDDVEPISPLAAIQTLQKLCNAAALASETNENDVVETSSKLIVLRAFFRALPPDERIVVVSGFTTTLDLVAGLCESENIKYARLQGSTPPKERTSIVRVFNTSGKILLLSTKAGGVGLNLVGANRLVLVDSSWNPAHDLQAQARIWRDGQTKSCYIYRLLSTGTIEERMFQRQELKGALARTLGFRSTSAATSDAGAGNTTFTQAELRDLFSYVKDTRCDTADRIDAMAGETPEHWRRDVSERTTDPLLTSAAREDERISFVSELPNASAQNADAGDIDDIDDACE